MKKENIKRPYGFWNWGTGIAIAITVGVLFFIFLVYQTTKIPVDFVVDDYYEKELEQNDKLAAKDNAKALGTINVKQDAEKISIQLPVAKVQQVAVHFYKPDNRKLDLMLTLDTDTNGIITVPREKLVYGTYKLILKWSASGKPFMVEESTFIQK